MGRKATTGITAKQKETLEAIQDWVDENSYPPSMQELAEVLSISHASAHERIGHLVNKGYLSKEDGKSRSIAVSKERVTKETTFVSLPILGQVAAGIPVLYEENKDGLIDVPDLLKGISFAKGLISSVLISFEDPERILVLKGNKPLTIWVNKRRKLIAYASQESWLERALEGQWGWKSMNIRPMTLSEFHTDKILEPCESPLEFTEMSQNAELLEDV